LRDAHLHISHVGSDEQLQRRRVGTGMPKAGTFSHLRGSYVICVVRPHCGLADAITLNHLFCSVDDAGMLRRDGESVGNSGWHHLHQPAGTLSVEILVLIQRVLAITWTVFPDTRIALSLS
jgi:hypothetical protein